MKRFTISIIGIEFAVSLIPVVSCIRDQRVLKSCIKVKHLSNYSTRCLISLVEITLSHLHVTRFHHAGDSDAEEEDRGGVAAGSSREVIIDESDENENERMVDKRR